MELGKRIKEYRNNLGWNQDELAIKMYVSRQTISNWENDKSYPDIQSLLLLSELFDVSLDQLVKGDIEKMTELINENKDKEIKQMDIYGKIMTVGMLVMAIAVIPLVLWLGLYGFLVLAVIYIPTIWAAVKIEKIKKDNDIQTYKEIIAFNKGEELDEITKQREIGKRPYQKAILLIIVSLVTIAICAVVGAICALIML